MTNLAGVVRLLKKEQDRLATELRGIGAALAAFGKTYGKGTRTRKLSASARAKIAAAQRARWAKSRERAKVVPVRGKRMLSAAGRRKIAAAQRARWARVKAGKKTA
jgi:ABC-type hemin transport system substrate-binding protein